MSNKTLELRSRSIGFPATQEYQLFLGCFSLFYLVFRSVGKAAGQGKRLRDISSRTFPQ